MIFLPAACRRSQLIGPYMLSMSTMMYSASFSATIDQPRIRPETSLNAALSADSVA